VKITTEIHDNWLGVIKLDGELDAYTSDQFREGIETCLASSIKFLLVDLTALQYIDSVGLGIMMGTAKRAGEQGGEIAVICDKPNLQRVFDISGTTELLNVRRTMDEALAILTKRRQEDSDK